jgi:hypothetical protein
MQHESFDNTGQKLPKIWSIVQGNEDETEDLNPVNIIEVPVSSFKKTSRFPLDTTPNFYNLYNFTGVTYRSGGGNPPTPLSCYKEDPPGTWRFIYPYYDYRVPVSNTPEDTSGCEGWELASSIGNIRTTLKFPGLLEDNIYSFELLSYLYDNEGNTVDSENFAQFYKWTKDGDGYDFSFYAYWEIPVNKEILLKAELVLLNKTNYNSIQYTKMQD